ncbi:class I SAM-dependent methyltransferase [Pararhizobium sp. IMCC21322]|uniref:class I SAM-dependent methyltransferase n=1 Tax=Pararhizobium sp. IMCC21322 TaxID=3067903 RepID=UPI002741801E|nr:class I SAM-dependent methyltransferase [Pararhizobium sp. IMCC21322]
MHRSGLLTEPDSADIYLQKNVPVSCCEIFGEQAIACAVARGDIRLLHNKVTGLISNAAFASSTQSFSSNYNGSQHSSAHFGRYAADLSKRLGEKHDLRGKHVVEIGCGDGTFLNGLCKISGARGTGIDPSLLQSASADGTIRFLAERLGEQHYGLEPDLIICRHTLEHIGELEEILQHVSGLMQGRTDIPFYVDVPDATRIADEGAFWDVYYEHCHYFTPDSLQNVLRLNGFKTEDIHTEFDGQYVCATAYLLETHAGVKPADGTDPRPQEVTLLTSRLATNLNKQRNMWRHWFERRLPRSVVLWGSGSKAVAFLTSLGLNSQVAAVVDINPDKQNSFLAGTGHPVVPPSELVDLSAEFIIIMNPAYVSEIKDVLADLSVVAKILVLGCSQPDTDQELPA